MFMAGVCTACALVPLVATAREYFVATDGDDASEGSAAKPWRTIQRAADVAAAGDVVTIRGGTYREWVKPAHAGRADAPIVYRAAKGERVVVTGADPVTDDDAGRLPKREARLAFDNRHSAIPPNRKLSVKSIGETCSVVKRRPESQKRD